MQVADIFSSLPRERKQNLFVRNQLPPGSPDHQPLKLFKMRIVNSTFFPFFSFAPQCSRPNLPDAAKSNTRIFFFQH